MARRLFEFFCNDCDGWILVNLNEQLRGEFLVECPSCKRQHPREFKNGEMVTSTTEIKVKGKVGMSIVRNFAEGKGKEIIKPMPSAYSKKSRLDKLQPTGRIGTTELWLNSVLKDA